MNKKTAEYDYEASSYDKDRFVSKLGQHFDFMHKKIVGDFIHASENSVLDVGTGTGRFATWLAKKGFNVTGVDVSKEMLKRAKIKAQSTKKNVGVVLADMRFLPFRTGLFDSCVCINVIDHISNVNKFFQEVSCVLKPKGFFIFNFSNLQSLYLPIAAVINLKQKALFKGGKILSRWITAKEINSLMVNTGFAVEETRGCFIASPLPFGEKLVQIIQGINFALENSKLKPFSGSLFVKGQLVKRYSTNQRKQR